MAKVESFKFWCQKVLPLVYDDSLSYYEVLCKLVTYLNNTIGAVNENTEDIANLTLAFNELQDFVNNYFDSLDVQEEINNKLDKMAEDGTLTNLIKPYLYPIIGYVTPEMFGAYGDGMHDDTLAIQNAIGDGNKLVYLSNTYKISEPIILKNRTTLLGNNTGKIIVESDMNILLALNCSFINIADLVLNKPCGTNYHIVCSGYKITIDHCELNGGLFDSNNYISGIHFVEPTIPNLDGYEFTVKNTLITVGQLVVEGGTDGYITDNVIWSSSIGITPNCYAIQVNKNSYDIKGNQIVPGKLGGLLLMGEPGACLFNVIDNYFDGSHESVQSGALLTIKNCDQTVLVSNNKFYNCYKNAITIDNSSYSLITSNTFLNNNRNVSEMANDIIFKNNAYGARAIVTNNQFCNYHTSRKNAIYTENKSIIQFNNNSIIGDGYTLNEDYGYIMSPNIEAYSNLRNGLLFKEILGTVVKLPDNNYGISINNSLINNEPVIDKVYINGVDKTDEYTCYLNSGSYVVVKGDDGYLGNLIKVIYHFVILCNKL